MSEPNLNPATSNYPDLGQVPLSISVRIGTTKLPFKDILKLSPGSILALNQATSDLLEVYVNGTLFAKGEAVVINERFGIRIVEILNPIVKNQNKVA